VKCPRRTCQGQVREVTDRIGRLHIVCDACERREAGVCAKCPRKVAGTIGQAKYCAECKKAIHRQRVRACESRLREFDPQRYAARLEQERLRAWRKRGALTPEERKARLQAAGRKAAATRSARLTPERKREIAQQAGKARWAKHRAAQ
jgi:hypothetical protein